MTKRPKLIATRRTIGDVYHEETVQLKSQFAALVAQRPTTVWLHTLAELHELKHRKSAKTKLVKAQLDKEVAGIRRIGYDTQL